MSKRITNAGAFGHRVMGLNITFLYAIKCFRTVACDEAKPVMDIPAGRQAGRADDLSETNGGLGYQLMTAAVSLIAMFLRKEKLHY